MPDSEDILEKILTDNPSAQTLCIVLRELLKKGRVRMAIFCARVNSIMPVPLAPDAE